MKPTTQNPSFKLTPWKPGELENVVGRPFGRKTRPQAGTDTVYFQAMRAAEMVVAKYKLS